MEKGLIIDIAIEKHREEKDFIPYPGIVEFIDKRVYFSVKDAELRTITIGVNLRDIVSAMNETFFEKGAD